MSDPQPIQQRISIEADTKGAEQASASLKELEQDTRGMSAAELESTRTTNAHAESIRKIAAVQSGLADLVDSHREKVKAGTKVTEEEIDLNKRREAQLRGVTAALLDESQKRERMNRIIGETTEELTEEQGALRDTADAADDAGDSFDDLGKSMGLNLTAVGLITAAVVAAGKAYAAWREEIQTTSQEMLKNEEIVRRNAEARIDLAALNGFEDPAQLLELDRLAVASGSTPAEAARAATFVNSAFPSPQFSNEQRSDFLEEVARQKQTSSASLSEIVGALYPLVLEGATPQQAGNIYQAGFKQAGDPDPAQYAAAAAEFVGTGKEIGGLDLGQAYGYAAGALSLGIPSPQTAITGLKALQLGIRTPQNDEAKALLERYGITSETPFDEALKLLSEGRAAGDVSDSDLVNLAGREGLTVASKLLRPEVLADFNKRVEIVDDAEDYKGNYAREGSDKINEPGSIQGYRLLAKQGEAEEEAIIAQDVEAARRDAARKQLKALLAEKLKAGELDEADVKVISDEFDYLLAQGLTVRQAINQAEGLQSGWRVPVPTPMANADGSPTTVITDTNVNPGKFLEGSDRRGENFLEDPLMKRLEQDPVYNQGGTPGQADPADQQGSLGLAPSLGQTADLGDMTAAMYEMAEELRRNNQLREQEQYQGVPQRLAAPIFNNCYINANDPIVGHLDGRDR